MEENKLPVFDDGKDAGAFRTIGEVAKALGIKHHVLRYWEEQFPMLSPLTRAGGRRYYRAEDIALIREIDRLLHHEGYTIRGARLAIEAAGKMGGKTAGKTGGKAGASASVPDPAPPAATPTAASPIAADPEVNEIVAALRVLRGHLEGIHGRLTDALQE
jgi:DNA-binding transcriptional MerR regulator